MFNPEAKNEEFIQALTTLVQIQHRERSALQAYSEAFQSRPARLVILKHFLLDEVIEKISQFLAVEAEFQTVYGLHSVSGHATDEEEWHKAEEREKLWQMDDAYIASVDKQIRLG